MGCLQISQKSKQSVGDSGRKESVLAELSKCKDDLKKSNQYEQELGEIEVSLERTKKVSEKYHELVNQISFKEHEIKGLESKLQNSSHAVLLSEVQKMEEEIETHNKGLVDMKEQLNDLEVRQVDLKKKLEDAPAERNRQMAKAEGDLKKASVCAEKARDKWYAAQESLNTTQLELDELEKEATDYTNKISSCEAIFLGMSPVSNTISSCEGISSDISSLFNTISLVKIYHWRCPQFSI